MSRDEIDTLWQQALHQSVQDGEQFTRYHFAALVAAAKEAQMTQEGWRQCAVGQRTTQFCGQVEQAVAAEREACAKVCEDLPAFDMDDPGSTAAKAIRERGNV